MSQVKDPGDLIRIRLLPGEFDEAEAAVIDVSSDENTCQQEMILSRQ